MGLGLQVLRAAELARAGRGVKEIIAAAERIRQATHIVFTIDTLEHLRRGGRIHTARAWLGTLLHVKPLLTLREGVLEPLEQVRTRGKAYARQMELTLDYLGNDRSPWISVMHSRQLEAAEELLAVLKTHFPQARTFCSEISPGLATHLGTGVGIIACPSTAL
jgi:DegV family protein with EDD domain